MTSPPLVSVIVATRNEERNIVRILRDLKMQTYPKIEVIVVDNESTDRTRELAAGEDGVSVYHLPEHVDLEGVMNFRGAQVNFGVTQAKGDIVFYPDADMTFERGLVADAVALLDDHDALFIPEVVMGDGFFGAIRRFERSFYNMTCIDAPRFVRRPLFDRVGGVDTKNIPFAPDDWDLHKTLRKADARFAITTAVEYHHEEWMTLSVYLGKKGDYTHAIEPYVRKWGADDPDVKRQLGVGYRFFGVFTENGKWKRLLTRPDLAIGMYALRFLVGVMYLLRR